MSNLQSNEIRVSRNFDIDKILTLPKLSVVIPCYDVAEYIPRLLHSLDEQDCSAQTVEIIFVIDGSPDNTEHIIAAWMKRSLFQVTLVWQQNRGVANARNTGNSYCRGELINSSDPDDSFSSNYFSEIINAAEENPEIRMFVSRMMRFKPDGTPWRHSLDYKFTNLANNTVVDLDERPEMIHLAGGVITLRREDLKKHQLKYDELLRTGFEDAHLIARYLLRQPKPQYMLLPKAQYFYWAREGSITSSVVDYRHKLQTVKRAYTQLLEEAGSVCPRWLGNTLLYDLYWVFRAHTSLSTTNSIFSLPAQARTDFHEFSRSVLRRIGIATIREFRVVTLSLDIRAAWEAAVDQGSVTHSAVRWAYDDARKLQKITFFSGHGDEDVTVFLESSKAKIAFRHVREVVYFERPWAYEHIFWVDISQVKDWQAQMVFSGPSGVQFTGAGKVYNFRQLQEALRANAPESPRGEELRALLKSSKQVKKAARVRRRQLIIERAKFSAAYRVGQALGWRRRFENAWVLMDSRDQANDNAEHLYRHIRKDRPDINAWFVNTRSSPDWKRLRREGFRLIDYGSLKHFVLMKHCSVLASSHLDEYVVQPFNRNYLSKSWIYSFLQHGVTKDRQDRWFNQKSIDHLVTSTQAETKSITVSPSPYKLSEREVTLTGMPRHDRLYRLCKKARNNAGRPRRILVMPTWRKELSSLLDEGKTREFAESEYVRKWSEFLEGDYVQQLASAGGTELIFLPHRRSASYWANVTLPTGVRLASYVEDDIQDLTAGADLVVTDYSSQAFEGAFCGAPCVYFQFDREIFFSGSHVYSPGYFRYDQDGFGPVVDTVDALVENVDLMLRGTHPNQAEYLQRIAGLYPLQDENACERVISEIEKRLTPYTLVG